MLVRLSTWSCLEIRKRDKVTISGLIIVSFERVEEFKYLGTTLTYQNSFQEVIKSILNSVNACYN